MLATILRVLSVTAFGVSMGLSIGGAIPLNWVVLCVGWVLLFTAMAVDRF